MQVEIPELDGFTPNQVRTLINSRGYKQFKDAYEGYRAGKCLFCDPLPAKNVVIYSNGTHRIWHNPFALKHTLCHLIVAPIRHILGSDPITFTKGYRDGETDVVVWAYDAIKELQKGGGEVKRFGLSEYNSGTIEHDHLNLIVPDLTGDVRMTIAKKPEEIQEAILRFNVYLKLLAGKTVYDLSIEERELVKGKL